MAGIVDKDSNLRVTGGGGGGSNVTIVGPLGQQSSANSIPVVIASDQSPIPVAFNGDGNTGSSPVTFSNGAGGPITISTPGEGSVIVKVVPTLPLTGSLTFKEQLITGGVYTDTLVQAVAGAGQVFPNSRYEIFEGSIDVHYGTPFYTLLIRARGINVQIGNGITAGAGNLVITAIFKSGAAWNVGTLINGLSGFAMEVTDDGAAFTTLIPPVADLLQASDPLAFGVGAAYPNIGEGVPIIGAATLLNDNNLGQFTTLPGDATNGAFVNVKASVPVAVNVPTSATGTLSGAGQTLPIDTTKANSVVVTVSATTGVPVGQIKFEGTNDSGVTWDKIYAKVLIGLSGIPDGSMITTINAVSSLAIGSTIFIIPCGGFQQVGLNALSITGGSVTFVLTTSSSDNLHDDKVELLGGLTGTKTPGDLIANPTDAIPSESFMMGWDSSNSAWSRVKVDSNTGNLLIHTDSGVTRTPVGNSAGTISSIGFFQLTQVGSATQAGGGRGTITISGGFTGITLKFYVASFFAPAALQPIIVRNVGTRVIGLDTGILSNPTGDTSIGFVFEFVIPTGMYYFAVTSITYGSGSANYQVLYDDLPLNLVLPSENPVNAKMNFNSPDYNQDGVSVPLSSDQNGRLRVNASDRELDFFGNNDAFLSVKDSPFSTDSPWS